jgi:hypothetical protein
VEGDYKALLSAINITNYKRQQLPAKIHTHRVIVREAEIMTVVQNSALAG